MSLPPVPGPLAARPRLFIDLQHGLANRLRALASAAVIAQKTGRELVVIWRPDAHCEARAGDLLQLPWPVIETDAADTLRARAAREYNYMEIEPGAVFDEGKRLGHWLLRAIIGRYVLAAYLFNKNQERTFLRIL